MKQEYWCCTERPAPSQGAAQWWTIPPLGWFWLAALGCIMAVAVGRGSEAKVFDVRQFGAKGDGKTVDTAAIQGALDKCGRAGGEPGV